MARAYDFTKTRRTNWDVKWNGAWLGAMGKVDVKLKITADPITTGTTGKTVIGRRIIGLEGTITVGLREAALAKFTALGAPWGDTSLTPAGRGADFYSFAKTLILHPNDLAEATTNEDLTLVKTVPMAPYTLSRDGTKDDEWAVDFDIYPDLSQMTGDTPKLVYGYIGPVPA